MSVLKSLVESLYKLDSPVIHTSGLIAHPVYYPADGIHPETIKMILGEPVIGRALEKCLNLSLRVDKILTAPLAVAHIISRMLVQVCSIILSKSISIQRKVHRYIIHDGSYAILVKRVNKELQVIRRSISCRRAEESRVLISPGLVARVLRKRHKLHVIVALLFQIFHKHRCYLSVCIPTLSNTVSLNDFFRCQLFSILIMHRLAVP